MKIQRKLLTLFLALALLLSLAAVLTVGASAETPSFEVTMVTSGSAKTGEQITVEVYITGTDIRSMVIAPAYDGDVLIPKRGRWVISRDTMVGEEYLSDLVEVSSGWDVDTNDAPTIAFGEAVTLVNEKMLEFTFEVATTAFDLAAPTVVSFDEVSVFALDPVTKAETHYTSNSNPEMFSVEDCSLTVECAHANTQAVERQAPTCYQIGYEAGVQCSLCSEFISGHGEIPATGNHTFTVWHNDGTHHWQSCSVDGCTAESTKAAHAYTNECDDSCNSGCGYTRVPPHKITAWGTDGENHWKKCANAGCSVIDESTKAAHTYTNECDATCDGGCGYTRTVEHAFDTWETDGNRHWKKCSKPGCSEIDSKSVAAHSYASTCVAECQAGCGHSRTNVPHAFSSSWKKDETNHWQECSNCGAKRNEAAHAKEGACDEVCNACGYQFTVSAQHEFEDTLTGDYTAHWYQCKNCSAKDGETDHVYDEGICDLDCNDCGYEGGKSHTYKTTWSTNKTGHWHECESCGHKVDEADHVPGPEATETTDQICKICEYIIVPRLGHQHSLTLVAAKTATCTENGNSAYYTCSGCEDWFADTEGKTVISDKNSVVVKASGHKETVDAAVAATCTSEGKTEGKSCAVCHQVLVAQEPVPATGHTFGEWTVAKEPTETENGLKARKCTSCEEVETEDIPATGPAVDPDTPSQPSQPDTPEVENMEVVIIAGAAVLVCAVVGITAISIRRRKRR